MKLGDRITLTWRFGKGLFLIGAVFNAVCARFQASEFSYPFLIDSFIVKVVITAVAVYLTNQFRDRDAIFFYINLGLSRRKLNASIILADFLLLAVIMTVIYLING